MHIIRWLIPVIGGCLILSEILFRYSILERAAKNGELSSYWVKIHPPLSKFTTVMTYIISFLLVTFMVTSASKLTTAKNSIGKYGIEQQIAGIDKIMDQLEEIQVDLERFDHSSNIGIKVINVEEKVNISLDEYKTSAILEIEKANDCKDICTLHYEFGRVHDPAQINVNIYYFENDMQKKFSSNNYTLSIKRLRDNCIGILVMKIQDHIFSDNRARIVISYSMSKINPDEPLAFYYLNPRDFGEKDELKNVKVCFDFGNLAISQPRIAIFNRDVRRLGVPYRKVSDDFQPKYFYNKFTIEKENLSDPFVLVFNFTDYPEQMIKAGFAKFVFDR